MRHTDDITWRAADAPVLPGVGPYVVQQLPKLQARVWLEAARHRPWGARHVEVPACKGGRGDFVVYKSFSSIYSNLG